MKFKLLLPLIFISASSMLFAQTKAPENWYNLDASADNTPGVSTEKMYSELLKGRTSETVIVAVIDSGIDADHEDLKEIMWVNPGEIAGNGIDDDKNGYIDDIHGWNFIGGKNGSNLNDETLEITRLVAMYNKIYKDVDVSSLSKKEKKIYDDYLVMKEEVDTKKSESGSQASRYKEIFGNLEMLEKHFGKAPTAADLTDFKADDEALVQVAEQTKDQLTRSGMSFAELKENVEGGMEYFQNQSEFYYNVDHDVRAKLVGDNYADQTEKNYGNNDVEGPDAFHGTHVAGIIGAVRDNEVGIRGVADNVRIMSIRAVPNGDERDKDIANAIRYAVDNGASIINMSFGKGYDYNKKIVDDAVKHAMKMDVLLVHAAGNDGHSTNDFSNNFPHSHFNKRGLFQPKIAKNWIEVGALTYKGGADAPASFSNYGKDNIDLFAPGYQIYSTIPGSEYGNASGTSMASPVVAGVAAVLRSYFPTLSAVQVKQILEETIIPVSQKVKRPGDAEMVSFSELCKTGGTINAYTAVKKAEKTKGKKKKKKKAKVIMP